MQGRYYIRKELSAFSFLLTSSKEVYLHPTEHLIEQPIEHPEEQPIEHPEEQPLEHPDEQLVDRSANGNSLLLYNIILAIDSGEEIISILPDSKKLFSAAGLEKLYFSTLLFSGLRESAKPLFTRKPKILENIKTARTGKFITFFMFSYLLL